MTKTLLNYLLNFVKAWYKWWFLSVSFKLGKLKHLPGFHISEQCETELQRMENKNQ
jgi:hypothetical protein